MGSKNEDSTKDHKTDLTPKSLASILGVILETTAEGFVHLIHQSAKDFIIDRNLFVNSSFGANIDPNIYIAKVCMTYLNFDDFKLGHINYIPEIEALKRSHPLLDYAARHWYSHIRDQYEVEHCFDLLLQIITPPSTLRFWSTVASIRPRDGNTRDHPLVVATNADIEWLASYLLSSENKNIEVAKNELEYAMIFGSDSIATAVAKSGKLSGGELVKFTVSNRNVGKEFVEEGLPSGITVTESMVTEALTNWMKGSEQLEALAARHDVEFTPEAVWAVAIFASENIMESLLRTHPSVEVTQEVIKAASANQRHGGGMMKVLLDVCKVFQLDAEIITATSLNGQGRMEVMGVCLDNEEVTMDEEAVALTIRNFSTENSVYSKEVMKLLLINPDIQITEKAVATIAQKFDIEIMNLLRSTHPDIQITESIVTAAAGNRGSGKEVMELLRSTHPDIQITESIVTAAAGNWEGGKEVMELLLSTHPDIQITESIVTAAAGNRGSGKEVMELLRLTHPDIQITEPIVTAAAGNRRSGNEVMKLLLLTHPDIQITEPIVTAAAGNRGNRREMMELLLSTHPDIQITEKAVAAIAEKFDIRIMHLLLSTHPDIQITEPIVMAAAGNWGKGREVMELLLSTHPDIQITEPIVTAAAGNRGSGKEVMELLLSIHPDIQITEPTATAAARNVQSGEELIELLRSTHTDIQITEPL
ncbi:hypothetical protein BDD12DRAFT_896545 [Trichophaea hybrida]|nr:hypothetical protein BDD12DRAFT_896545 [Trichophaea hybrida]